MSAYLENDAVISDCGRYRYLLRRVWDFKKPRALVDMLNPSTADARMDDPTVKSVVRLTNALGFGSFEIANLYGWRETDPDALLACVDPVGPDNDQIVAAAISRCDVTICAWGAHKMAERRSRAMIELVRSLRPSAFCFGKTKAGAPKHPLYIKTGTALESYP
jgi:hypothetical protein